MSFVYTENANCDQIISHVLSNAFISTGATIYLVAPYRARVMEAGFIPLTGSVVSNTTFQVKVGDNVTAGTSSFGTVLIASGTGTFASGTVEVGQFASVSLTGTTILKRGDALQCIMSGGHASSSAATVYAILRRTVSQ